MGVSPSHIGPQDHRPGAWDGFYLIIASNADSQEATVLGPKVALEASPI